METVTAKSPRQKLAKNHQRQQLTDEQRAHRLRVRQAYARTFHTEDGRTVLEDLTNYFGQSTVAADPHMMVVAGAMRSVIDHIDRAIEDGSGSNEGGLRG